MRFRLAAKHGFDEINQGKDIVLKGKKEINQFIRDIETALRTSARRTACKWTDNLGISYSIASLDPTPWRSDVSSTSRWILRQIFRKVIAVCRNGRPSGSGRPPVWRGQSASECHRRKAWASVGSPTSDRAVWGSSRINQCGEA